jgi:uncharacterized protein YkwD
MDWRRFIYVAAVAGASLAACAAAPRAAQAPAADARVKLEFSTSCGIAGLREKVLREVNAARVAGPVCGSQRMTPAPPLLWNDALFSAAARHSADMARHNYFDHVDKRGDRIAQRASAEGYPWRSVGENIAGGDESVERVVRGWIASPEHCRNMMAPEFKDIGVACVRGNNTEWGTYWTMVLGRQR